MKVILLKDVAKVGKIHDVKDVSDGYALNSLIPRGLAKIATPDALKAHERARNEVQKTGAAHAERLHQALQEFAGGKKLSLSASADKNGNLYKKITENDIVKSLSSVSGVDFSRVDVHGGLPIKKVGEHEIELRTQSGTHAKVVVVVGN